MKLLKFIASMALSFSAAAIGGLATTPNIPTWYAGLEKPFFNPPNWVFGPVWSVLYVLIGISLYLLWTSTVSISKKRAYILFFVQLALNALWSIIFFGLHLPWMAFAIILGLLVSIITYQRAVKPFSAIAAHILIPYVLWVTFASCLNLAIAILN